MVVVSASQCHRAEEVKTDLPVWPGVGDGLGGLGGGESLCVFNCGGGGGGGGTTLGRGRKKKSIKKMRKRKKEEEEEVFVILFQ